MKKGQGQTIRTSGYPSVRSLYSLVVSSLFPLFWSVLFWSAPALPSSLFLLSFHPSSFPGGVVGHGSVPLCPHLSFVRLSFVFPFYFPGRGMGVWYLSLLFPSLPVSFPASLAVPFHSVLWLVLFGSVPVFPAFLLSFPFLLS